MLAQLLSELNGQTRSVQPLILEEGMDAGLYIHVVWDRWERWPEEERTRLIVEAYEHFNKEIHDKLINAIGVTPVEALEVGLLPFRITDVPKRGQTVDSQKIEKAIEEERKNTVLGRRFPELRYASLEEAEQARQRLERAEQDVFWVITQEVGKVSDFYSS